MLICVTFDSWCIFGNVFTIPIRVTGTPNIWFFPSAKKFIVIVDEGKVMEEPIEGKVSLEVLQFAVPFVMKLLKDFDPKIRMAKKKLGPVVSDNGSLIVDCHMKLENPKKTEVELDAIPGVIENGIFTKFDEIIVGSEKGSRNLIKK